MNAQTHNLPKVSSILTIPIDDLRQTRIIKRSTHRTMTLTVKFKKDVQTLSLLLMEKSFSMRKPKLFKKVRRFYENTRFSGDV